jgi:histidinol dehydrogenase
MISRLDINDPDFSRNLDALLEIGTADEQKVRQVVTEILADVRQRGDAALLELTRKFDRREVEEFPQLEIPQHELKQAYENLDPIVREALEASARRVRDYHQNQLKALGGGTDWNYTDGDGNELGQFRKFVGIVVQPRYDQGGDFNKDPERSHPSQCFLHMLDVSAAKFSIIFLSIGF